MKIEISLKDPDAVSEALSDKRRELIPELMKALGICEDAAEIEASERLKKMEKLMYQFFEWGEYVNIEFDDEAGTATLIRH